MGSTRTEHKALCPLQVMARLPFSKGCASPKVNSVQTPRKGDQRDPDLAPAGGPLPCPPARPATPHPPLWTTSSFPGISQGIQSSGCPFPGLPRPHSGEYAPRGTFVLWHPLEMN